MLKLSQENYTGQFVRYHTNNTTIQIHVEIAYRITYRKITLGSAGRPYGLKEKDAGWPLGPVIDKMNQMAKDYLDKSRPIYCAQQGFVDEISKVTELRGYMKAFAGAAYQNPRSICPHHQMMLPRIIKG